MRQIDRVGFFRNQNHMHRFVEYLNFIYSENFKNFAINMLPSKEVSYIYSMSYLLDIDITNKYLNFSEFKYLCDLYNYKIDKQNSYLYEVVEKCLDGIISYDLERFSERYDDIAFIKNVTDVAMSDYDISIDKKFDILYTAINYIELSFEQSQIDFLER